MHQPNIQMTVNGHLPIFKFGFKTFVQAPASITYCIITLPEVDGDTGQLRARLSRRYIYPSKYVVLSVDV